MDYRQDTCPSCCSPARSQRPPPLRRRRRRCSRPRRRKARSSGTRRSTSRSPRRSPRRFAPSIRRSQIEVERSGSERVFQRINQEYQSGIKNVDVVNSSDASHFIFWKQQKWLAPHTPPDVQALTRRSSRIRTAITRCGARRCRVMGYNTNLVPRRRTRRPATSTCSIRNGRASSSSRIRATAARASPAPTRSPRLLGWDYLEKLSKQGVQQLQSTTATPKSIASGERAVMVDGNEYNMFIEIDAKSPVKIIYPKEGTPFVTSPTAIFADAPHPNAARVLQNFLYTAKIQQLAVDEGGTRSVHPDVKEPAGPHAAVADQAAARRSGRQCCRRSPTSRSATRRCSATDRR